MAGSDGDPAGTLHLLDMGQQIYGDCIVAQFGGKTILIDGGHPADYAGQQGFESIPDQLKTLLGGHPPFKISLLVVTHCHNDHVGCLPELVRDSIIEPEWALVTDEHLGFGRAVDSDSPLDALPPDARALVVALQEEDHSDLDDAELSRFLADAVTVESRYKTMLATLRQRGTRIVRHGRDDEGAIEHAFADAGLKILGPTQDQLLICSEIISRTTKDAIDAVRDAGRTDANPVNVYRRLMTSPTGIDLLDRPGRGAAFNDQSIVLKLGSGNNKVLLAGDMQFAMPEVKGLDQHMAQLRAAVKAAGPYRFAKASHHTSYNGVDESVLEDLGNPPLIGHSGGSNDPGHPDRKTLGVLKGLSRRFKYARTDRNGLVTLGVSGFEIAHGRLNDFTPNAGRDFQLGAGSGAGAVSFRPSGGAAGGPPGGGALVTGQGGAIDLVYMRVPYLSGRFSIGNIPISLEFGGSLQGLMENAPPPQGVSRTDVPPQKATIAAGRTLPKLLFATSRAALGRKLGADVAGQVARIVQDAGQTLCDVADPAELAGEVAQRLRAGGDYHGVVLLGGYDVAPSQRVDVLDAPLRQSMGSEAYDDPDNFVVWSDDLYGDLDGDGIAECAVSRIPDGGSASLLMSCLTGTPPGAAGRFGIRNSARPFADGIWSILPGSGAILVSGPARSSTLTLADGGPSHLYLMLHGDFEDSSRFWGEDQGLVEAINVSKLPHSGVGTVFAGCCWGALTVTPIAAKTAAALKPKAPETSMALSFLKAGARAFVGCTGAHYSPDSGAGFFGGPMHRHFWEALERGVGPAEALFAARKQYLAEMPHGMSRPFHLGIERKIYKQFTCLGLGW